MVGTFEGAGVGLVVGASVGALVGDAVFGTHDSVLLSRANPPLTRTELSHRV